MKEILFICFLLFFIHPNYAQNLSDFFPEEPNIRSTALISNCEEYLNKMPNGVVYVEEGKYSVSNKKYDDFQIQYANKNIVAGNLYLYCFSEYLLDKGEDIDQLYRKANFRFIFESSNTMYLIGCSEGYKPGIGVFVLDSAGLLIYHYIFSDNKVNYRNLDYLDMSLKRSWCKNHLVKNRDFSRRCCKETGFEVTSIKVITDELNNYLVSRNNKEVFYRKEYTSDFYDLKFKEFQRIIEVLKEAKYDNDFVAFDHQGTYCFVHLIYLISGKEIDD